MGKQSSPFYYTNNSIAVPPSTTTAAATFPYSPTLQLEKGSREETNATSTQPLLPSNLKPSSTNFLPPPLSEADSSQYLQISLTPNQSRTPKDRPFILFFSLLNLTTFAFGIFACFHRNPNSGNLSSFTYDPTSYSCVGPIYNSPPKRLSLSIKAQSVQSPTSSDSNIWLNLVYTLLFTLFLSIPISLCLLFSLRRYTKQLVYMCLPFLLILPISFSIYAFVSCSVSSTCSVNNPLGVRILFLIFGFAIDGLIVWSLVANRNRVEFTIRIIGIASHALWRNLGLFVVLPALNLALAAYYVPIGVFFISARLNGVIVPEDKDGEFVCSWKQDSWVPFFYTLASLTMLWSTTSMAQAQAYVISGTVARWYFAKDGSSLKRSIRSSLRNAFGPSAGTICLSGLVVGVVRLVRAAVDRAAREDGSGGILFLILRCFVKILLTVVEFLNKFTINFAAITGEAYCTSARMTYELLRRNLLSTVIVETISSRILGGIIFIISAIYAVLVFAILYVASDLGEYLYFIVAMAWVVLLLVMGYLVYVLNNVIDTVYICYAIDKDKGEVGNPDVHEIYLHLPSNRNYNRSSLVAGTPLNV